MTFLSEEHLYAILMAIVGFLTLLVNQFSNHKKSDKEFNDLKKSVLRIELNQAIEFDYGKMIVSELLDEYILIGGNSYMAHKAKKYFEMKDKIEGGEE